MTTRLTKKIMQFIISLFFMMMFVPFMVHANQNIETYNIYSEATRRGYDQSQGIEVFSADNSENVFEINVPEKDYYVIELWVQMNDTQMLDPEISVLINQQLPFLEANRITIPIQWKDGTSEKIINRYNNQTLAKQVPVTDEYPIILKDTLNRASSPYFFELDEGTQTIKIDLNNNNVKISKLKIYPISNIEERKKALDLSNEHLIVIEAESYDNKNSSYSRAIAYHKPEVTPYDVKTNLLNTFGGESWAESGQSVSWTFEVPEDNNYQITLKTLQNYKEGVPALRNFYLDGYPLSENLLSYPIEASHSWENTTLLSDDDVFEVYLTAGIHTLTIEADTSPYESDLLQLENLLNEINDLGLQLNQLVGSQTDIHREWDLIEFIPDIKKQFKKWLVDLEEIEGNISEIGNNSASNEHQIAIGIIYNRLEALSENINELPNNLSSLSQGSGSVTQLIGQLSNDMRQVPLLIDQIYIHGRDATLPVANISYATRIKDSIMRFIYSFKENSMDVSTTDEDTIEIWVGRSQQYVELMQEMADASFTPQTGIPVQMSIMPNESKIILANAANQQPDVALGLSVGQPYELAIRNRALPLSDFPDFYNLAKNFSPGSFLPLVLDDKIYGLPETQDFYVLFYRKDILENLDLSIPDTWDDVLALLPELHRAGKNVFIPLSGGAGMKPFMFTAPFIQQMHGEIYSEDGMHVALQSDETIKALQLMTNLFTLYGLPIQVPNFYNSFKYGDLPLGISNFETYVKLTAAAPEISGSWGISLYPGIVHNGIVERWAPGSAQTAMIFNETQLPDESWEFLKWWLDEKTQTEFATRLQSTYGPEFMWHTANNEAFKNLPWPEEHKDIILEQWNFLLEVPKIPGSYMIERELSNVWTDVVFNGENIRSALDDSVTTSNREIQRKMEEFGYMSEDKPGKSYKVPKLKDIEKWLEEGNKNE